MIRWPVFCHPGATVVALESDGSEQIVMISVDLTAFALEFLNELRYALKAVVPDLNPSKIIMNATHTHSAPAVSPSKSWWEPDSKALPVEVYRRFVIERLWEASALPAETSLKPC